MKSVFLKGVPPSPRETSSRRESPGNGVYVDKLLVFCFFFSSQQSLATSSRCYLHIHNPPKKHCLRYGYMVTSCNFFFNEGNCSMSSSLTIYHNHVVIFIEQLSKLPDQCMAVWLLLNADIIGF